MPFNLSAALKEFNSHIKQDQKLTRKDSLISSQPPRKRKAFVHVSVEDLKPESAVKKSNATKLIWKDLSNDSFISQTTQTTQTTNTTHTTVPTQKRKYNFHNQKMRFSPISTVNTGLPKENAAQNPTVIDLALPLTPISATTPNSPSSFEISSYETSVLARSLHDSSDFESESEDAYQQIEELQSHSNLPTHSALPVTPALSKFFHPHLSFDNQHHSVEGNTSSALGALSRFNSTFVDTQSLPISPSASFFANKARNSSLENFVADSLYQGYNSTFAPAQ